MKLGTETGSLTNYLIGNSKDQTPIVGQGATELRWTDRQAYEVLEVSEDGKSCIIQSCGEHRIDNGDYFTEDQEYSYTPDERFPKIELVFKYGSWRRKIKTIDFCSEEIANLPLKSKIDLGLFQDSGVGLKLVEGFTKIKTSYDKINIKFGIKQSYRDPSF